jgi:hypothetical protein
VVSYSWVIENGTSNGSGLESGMAYDAVRHLQSVADRSAAALPQPPGKYLTAGALMKQLLSPFPAALVPAGLSSPAVFPTTQNTTGLEQHKFIKVSFVGSGPDYTSGSIWFYVFDTAQDAQSYFGARPQPLWYGVADTPTDEVRVPPSGFSSAQQAQCNTYSAPARARPLFGASSCVVQWGNVVVWGVSWDNATSANPKPTAADTNMAITLARAGLLRVGQAVYGRTSAAVLDGLIPSAISAGNHCHKADSPGFGATAKVDCSSVPNIPASRVSYYLFANPAALNNAS